MGFYRAFGIVLVLLAPLLSVAGATPVTESAPTDLDVDAAAPGDPSPYSNNAIDATYRTHVLPSFDGFQIDVDIVVYEMDIPPLGGRTATEIRAAPQPVRQLFESGVHLRVLDEAQRVLPDARVTLQTLDFHYDQEDYDADPYHPGIRIHAIILAKFTPEFFGLREDALTPAADVARSFLYSGGSYAIRKELDVPAGWTVRHVVSTDAPLELKEWGRGGESRLTFAKDNLGGVEADKLRVQFALRLRPDAVPANVQAGPLVKALFVVDDVTPLWKESVPFSNGDYRGTLDLDIELHSLETDLFAQRPLPSELSMPRVSGDLIRVGAREGLIDIADLQDFFENLIRHSLEEGFGPGVELQFDWPAFEESLQQPLGGSDGTQVDPVIVRAKAALPFESSKMFISSGLGKLFGMTFGTRGEFDLSNDGMWDAEYTVAYPRGVQIEARDSEGLLEPLSWSDRDGFRVTLERGSTTQVVVEGRSPIQWDVLALAAAQLAAILALAWWGWRKLLSLRPRSTSGATA